MQRFFVQIPLIPKMVIRDERICNQLFRVLRMRYGDQIILFNGDTKDIVYQVEAIGAKEVILLQKSSQVVATEPPVSLTLCQALPNKWEKIELIVQKGVEMGIAHFIFFRSERSQVLPISPAKIARIQSIATEALEQCGGSILPQIDFLQKTPVLDAPTQFVLNPLASEPLVHTLKQNHAVSTAVLWVGPEGGWSEKELEQFTQNNCLSVSLGNRILRTETAGIVASFLLLSCAA